MREFDGARDELPALKSGDVAAVHGNLAGRRRDSHDWGIPEERLVLASEVQRVHALRDDDIHREPGILTLQVVLQELRLIRAGKAERLNGLFVQIDSSAAGRAHAFDERSIEPCANRFADCRLVQQQGAPARRRLLSGRRRRAKHQQAPDPRHPQYDLHDFHLRLPLRRRTDAARTRVWRARSFLLNRHPRLKLRRGNAERHPRFEAGTATGRRADFDVTVHGAQALAHTGKTESLRGRRLPKASAVVGNPQMDAVAGCMQTHGRRCGLAVLHDVLQRLLRHAIQAERDIGGKVIGNPIDVALNLDRCFLGQVRTQPRQREHQPEILEVRRVQTARQVPQGLRDHRHLIAHLVQRRPRWITRRTVDDPIQFEFGQREILCDALVQLSSDVLTLTLLRVDELSAHDPQRQRVPSPLRGHRGQDEQRHAHHAQEHLHGQHAGRH